MKKILLIAMCAIVASGTACSSAAEEPNIFEVGAEGIVPSKTEFIDVKAKSPIINNIA